MTIEHMIEILKQYPNSVFGDALHGGAVTIPEIVEVLKGFLAADSESIIHCQKCYYYEPAESPCHADWCRGWGDETIAGGYCFKGIRGMK